MFGLGPTELIIGLIVVLLLFGAKRIPEIAGSFGKSIKEFKLVGKPTKRVDARDKVTGRAIYAGDIRRPGMLYAATERSMYVSYDHGRNWESLKRNLPPVPVHDIALRAGRQRAPQIRR